MLSVAGTGFGSRCLLCATRVAVDNRLQLLLSLTGGGVASDQGFPRKFNHDFDSVCH